MTLTSRIIDVDGRAVEVAEAGTGGGAPLVFLHGGSMIGGIDFLSTLAEHHRVVVPFLPGYGGSDLEPLVEGAEGVTEHLAAVLDVLGLDQVVLVAHSLGGWRAVQFAAAHPARVERLVLGAPLGLDVPGHPVTNMMELTPPERLAVLTYDEAIQASWVPAGPEFVAARQREQVAMARFAPRGFDPELPETLATIAAPVLILWGEGDRLIPVAHAEAWAKALPQARIVTYPGAGHLVFHERPESVGEVAAAVSEGAWQ